MKRNNRIATIFFLVLFYFTNSFIIGQSLNFAVISDLHIGATNAEENLSLVINDINLKNEIQFVIATGDITEKGKNEELEDAKNLLDRLNIPYYIIPGNHDTKWSESGCTKFIELWNDNKFYFQKSLIHFIGLNSGICMRGGGGHISIEDLHWLDSIITKINSNEKILFFTHHPLDGDIDNWFKATNILQKKNIRVIFYGHGHSNKFSYLNDIPAIMTRSTLSDKNGWGYSLFGITNDSLFTTEINAAQQNKMWASISLNDTLIIPKIDSLQFENYSINILWQKDLNKTIISSPLVYEDKIVTTTANGEIFCFNQNGNQIWNYNTNSRIVSRSNAIADILVVGTISGDLYTFDINTGKVLQILGLGESITSQISFYTIQQLDEQINFIIVGTNSGTIHCYEFNTLNPVWSNSDATGMIETRPLVIKDKVIYGSWDGYLYCVDAKTGLLIWKWSENKNFYYSPASCIPVSDGKNIYITTPDKYTSAIDLLLGKTIWRKNTFSSWESIGISNEKKRLFIKSDKDKFYIVNAASSSIIKNINLGYGLDTSPNEILEFNGNIIFGGKNGIIYLIDKNYNSKKLLFLGNSRVHSIYQIFVRPRQSAETGGKENTFVSTNMDGKIVVFSLP